MYIWDWILKLTICIYYSRTWSLTTEACSRSTETWSRTVQCISGDRCISFGQCQSSQDWFCVTHTRVLLQINSVLGSYVVFSVHHQINLFFVFWPDWGLYLVTRNTSPLPCFARHYREVNPYCCNALKKKSLAWGFPSQNT